MMGVIVEADEEDNLQDFTFRGCLAGPGDGLRKAPVSGAGQGLGHMLPVGLGQRGLQESLSWGWL